MEPRWRHMNILLESPLSIIVVANGLSAKKLSQGNVLQKSSTSDRKTGLKEADTEYFGKIEYNTLLYKQSHNIAREIGL